MNKFAVLIALCLASSVLNAKTIMVLMDGTWNVPSSDESQEADTGEETNVALLKRYLVSSENGPQLVQYHHGIGTDGKLLKRIIDGAMGRDAEKKVDKAYSDLLGAYSEGDEVVIFGFSRGAATARMLARKIANKKFSSKFIDPESVRISFIGVWDTVVAVGVPKARFDDEGFRKEFDAFSNAVKIPSIVDHVVHHVAIDEMRSTFVPTLLTLDSSNTNSREVWFPGTHGDVGGGWEADHETIKLSDLTLYCMLNEMSSGMGELDARKPPKLQFKSTSFLGDLKEDVLVGDVVNSEIHRKKFDPTAILGGEGTRTISVDSSPGQQPIIDASTLFRINHDDGYHPKNYDSLEGASVLDYQCYR